MIQDSAVNVKDYGAAGDGTTDDTTAITNAINASAGQSTFFPEGTYLVDTITISSASNYLLSLDTDAIIKHKDSATDVMLDFTSSSSTVRIDGGVFDGNKDNQTALRGCIKFMSNNFDISNTTFQNISEFALSGQSTSAQKFVTKDCKFVDGNFTDDYGSTDPCVFIQVYKRTFNKVEDCLFYGADHPSDRTKNPSAINFSGNAVTGTIIIRNNVLEDMGNSQGGSPTQAIKIYSYTDYCLIEGNEINNSPTQSIVVNTSNSLVVRNNKISYTDDIYALGGGNQSAISCDNNERSYAGVPDNLGDWIIEGNSIVINTGGDAGGIHVSGGIVGDGEVRNITISNNIMRAFVGVTEYAVLASMTCRNIKVAGNIIEGDWANGVRITGGLYSGATTPVPIVISNNIFDGQSSGVRINTSDTEFYGVINNNIFTNNSNMPIRIDGIERAVVDGNAFNDNFTSEVVTPTKRNGEFKNMDYLAYTNNIGCISTGLYNLAGHSVTEWKVLGNESLTDNTNP